MKLRDTLLTTALMLFLSMTATAQTWTSIATDIDGDGASGPLLDGKSIDYWYDQPNDMLWFKVEAYTMTVLQSQNLGVNILFNIDGSSLQTFNFWGNDNKNAYHKMITVWVTGNAPSNYSGTIGVCDAAGVNSMVYNNLHQNNIEIEVDQPNSTIILKVPRHHIIPLGQFPPSTGGVTMDVAAAVGSNQSWNDDIYNPSGSMTITPNASSVKKITAADISLKVYPNPAANETTISYSLKNTSNVSIQITDVTGKIVSTIAANQAQQAGDYKLPVNLSGFSNGIYFVKVLINNTPAETTKLIVVS